MQAREAHRPPDASANLDVPLAAADAPDSDATSDAGVQSDDVRRALVVPDDAAVLNAVHVGAFYTPLAEPEAAVCRGFDVADPNDASTRGGHSFVMSVRGSADYAATVSFTHPIEFREATVGFADRDEQGEVALEVNGRVVATFAARAARAVWGGGTRCFALTRRWATPLRATSVRLIDRPPRRGRRLTDEGTNVTDLWLGPRTSTPRPLLVHRFGDVHGPWRDVGPGDYRYSVSAMGFVAVSPNAPPRRLDGPAVRAFNGCPSVTWTMIPESSVAILAGCQDGDPENAPEGLPVGSIPAEFPRQLYRVDVARPGDDATLVHTFTANILEMRYDDCRRMVYVWTDDRRAWWVTPEGAVTEDPRPTPFEP